jgi:hypothetical protein
MAMLIRWDFEFPAELQLIFQYAIDIEGSQWYSVPFIQAHCILDKQQRFVGEQRWTKSCRQIKRLEEHLACNGGREDQHHAGLLAASWWKTLTLGAGAR